MADFLLVHIHVYLGASDMAQANENVNWEFPVWMVPET